MVMAGWKFSHLAGETIQFATDGKPLQVTAGQVGQHYPVEHQDQTWF